MPDVHNKNDYFAIIIGGGPAGLSAAKILGNAGEKVLLIEKNDKLGPKVCAGGLTTKTIKHLRNIPSDYLYQQEVVYEAGNSVFRVQSNKPFISTITREKLAEWQVSEINRRNVKIVTNSRVTKIYKNCIITDKKEKYYFKFLIGADGSDSIVRKHLNLPVAKLNIAIHYIVPILNFKFLLFSYNSKLFNSWYAWVFPHKNFASIGYCYDPKVISTKEMKKNFAQWLKDKKIDVSRAKYEGFFINHDFRGFEFKNIYLAGDAAGLGSPLNDEGIYQALISGQEIAKIILNPLHSKKKLNTIIRKTKRDNRIILFLRSLGPLRPIIFKIVGLALITSFTSRRIIKALAED